MYGYEEFVTSTPAVMQTSFLKKTDKEHDKKSQQVDSSSAYLSLKIKCTDDSKIEN